MQRVKERMRNPQKQKYKKTKNSNIKTILIIRSATHDLSKIYKLTMQSITQ